jgi:uncharacterized membrane protein YgcG
MKYFQNHHQQQQKVFLKMWHQEILNQQLDKIVKQVIICQKVVRGFLCRRRLLHLLELVQQQANEKVAFINQIHKQGCTVLEKLNSLRVKVKANELEPLTTVYEMAESMSEQHQHQLNDKMQVPPSSHHPKSSNIHAATAANSKHAAAANKAPASVVKTTNNSSNNNSSSNNYNNNNNNPNINKLSNAGVSSSGGGGSGTAAAAAAKKGEKIQSLKNQLEKQMKDYAKQEEYEEMLKLVKVSACFVLLILFWTFANEDSILQRN